MWYIGVEEKLPFGWVLTVSLRVFAQNMISYWKVALMVVENLTNFQAFVPTSALLVKPVSPALMKHSVY